MKFLIYLDSPVFLYDVLPKNINLKHIVHGLSVQMSNLFSCCDVMTKNIQGK